MKLSTQKKGLGRRGDAPPERTWQRRERKFRPNTLARQTGRALRSECANLSDIFSPSLGRAEPGGGGAPAASGVSGQASAARHRGHRGSPPQKQLGPDLRRELGKSGKPCDLWDAGLPGREEGQPQLLQVSPQASLLSLVQAGLWGAWEPPKGPTSPFPVFCRGGCPGGDLPVLVTLHHTTTCLTGEQWEVMPSLCTLEEEGPAQESRKAAIAWGCGSVTKAKGVIQSVPPPQGLRN